jgi:AcrR family transcriptional regulator
MIDTGDSREAILLAAERLFMDQGFRGISMRQIAEAVGVTKAALYYHFQDKEELFVAIVERYLVAMSTLIDTAAAGSGSCRAQISAIVQRILTQPVEERAILRLTSQELSNVSPANRARFMQMYHERFINRITALLEAGMASGELRVVEPSLATWTLLGMMYPYFHPSPPPGRSTSSEQINAMLSIFFDGLAKHALAPIGMGGLP